MMGGGRSGSSIILPLAAVLGAWLCGPGYAHAGDGPGVWQAVVPDAELARESGLGVALRGDGNAAAQAQGTATVTGDTIAESITAGSIRHLNLQQVSGINVFQINTGQNVNQIVNQALVVEIIDPSGPSR